MIQIQTTPAERIGGYFRAVLDLLGEWAGPLDALFAAPAHRPSRRQVDAAVEPLAAALLDRADLSIAGAGFVAAHSALTDAPWHMAWWQGGSKERLARLTPQEMGETYARREWFTVPLESGRAHVTGPYVDFLCTDEYTVTMTLPVGGARPVGVAGADVFVESLEGVFGADLAAVHPAATLVNRSGRVVVSADPQLAAGTVLAPGWQSAAGVPRARGELWGGAELQAEACSRLPLAVVYPRA